MNGNLNIIWGIGISIVPYFILAFIPVWDQLRYSKKSVIIAGSLCTIINIVSVIIIIELLPNWDNLRAIHSVFFLLGYIFIYIIMVKGTPAKLIFIALLVKSYADFTVNMAKFFEVNFTTYAQHQVYVHTSYAFLFNFFQCLVLLATYPLIWVLFRKKVSSVMKTHNKAWRFLWVIPLVFYIISVAFGAMNFELISKWQFFVFNSVSFFGFYLIYYVVIEMLEQSERNIILSESNKVIKQQLTLQSNYYKKFGECIEETRKKDHDLRHHLNTLQGLMSQKNNEKAEKYVSELLGNRLSVSDILYCENDAVNALLGYYANICKQEEIEIVIATMVPNNLEIDETDLCVVFGNLIENALEASRRMKTGKKIIKISSQFISNRLFITIDNHFDGEVKIKNGAYLSRKRNDQAGIGIISVTAIAQKYVGEVVFKVRDQIFFASIVLSNKKYEIKGMSEVKPSALAINNNTCQVEH